MLRSEGDGAVAATKSVMSGWAPSETKNTTDGGWTGLKKNVNVTSNSTSDA